LGTSVMLTVLRNPIQLAKSLTTSPRKSCHISQAP
jgi:hypothetical protein